MLVYVQEKQGTRKSLLHTGMDTVANKFAGAYGILDSIAKLKF